MIACEKHKPNNQWFSGCKACQAAMDKYEKEHPELLNSPLGPDRVTIIAPNAPLNVFSSESESILQEAQRLTHGDRNKDYGHPLDDYTRTVKMVNAMLSHKLKEPLTADECAMIMCCVKLSRQANHPKRDNMTDLAGYAWVVQECIDEKERRDKKMYVHKSL